MKNLGYCSCDKGSIVINGICISNGIGDGVYDIRFYESEEEATKDNFKVISHDLWIDLRYTDIEIWTYDCNSNCKKILVNKENINADALKVYKKGDGSIAFVKYF